MRFSRELRSLISYLKHIAGLGGAPKDESGSPVQWDRWIDLVDEHQLGPLLGSRVAASSAMSLTMPAAVLDALRARTIRSGLDAAFQTVEHVRLFNLLEADLSPVALKGAAVVHTLYGEASEREMSDYDLLLPSQEDAQIAEVILRDQGFNARYANTSSKHHHRAPITNGTSELTIEIHTNLTTPSLPKTAILEMCRMRRKVELPAGTIYVLDPIAALLHHALHAVADPIDSPLLRNLFEVAWLTQKLSRMERTTVRTLARRWGVEDRVAGALSLAHEIFGSPRITEKKTFGAREHWCLRRLAFTSSFGELSWKERFLRDLGRRHIHALDLGASPRSPLPLIKETIIALTDGIRSRISGYFATRPQQLEPVTLHSTSLGNYLVAHDSKTGYVHLLDGLSTAVLRASRKENDARKLENILAERGIEGRTTRLALDQLLERGLLRERRGRHGDCKYKETETRKENQI
jgi:hypothetical protein